MHLRRSIPVLFTVICQLNLPSEAQTVTVPLVEPVTDKAQDETIETSPQLKALRLLQAGKPDEAATVAEAFMAKVKDAAKPVVVASCHSLLGKIYRRQGRLDDGLKEYETALKFWRSEPNSNYMQGMILTNMGEALLTLKNYAEARKDLTEASEILDPKAPNVCATFENLGTLDFKVDKFDQAEQNYKKAIELARAGKDARCEMTCKANLLAIYLKQNKVDKAQIEREALRQRIIEINGPTDPQLAILKNLPIPPAGTNLSIDPAEYNKHMQAGAEFNRENDQVHAEEEYGEAAKAAEKFGEKDERLISALNNFATACSSQQKLDKAIPIYLRAIRLSEKNLGKNHVSQGEMLNGLAISYAEQGKYAEGEPYMKRALPLLAKTLGESSPRYQQSKKLYLVMQVKSGKLTLQDARNQARGLITTLEGTAADAQKPKAELPPMWQKAMILGKQELAAGNTMQAVMQYQTALDLVDDGKHDDATSLTLVQLGAAYMKAGSLKKSSESLARAIPMFEKLHPDDKATAQSLKDCLTGVQKKMAALEP